MKKILNRVRKWIRKGEALPHEFGPIYSKSLTGKGEDCCAEGCCVNKTSTDGLTIRGADSGNRKAGNTNKGNK